MASSKKSKESSNITRIKATDSSAPKKDKPNKSQTNKNKDVKPKEASVTKKTSNKPSAKTKPGLMSRLMAYFKASWQELKKVQWPDRKATWSLTVAVILFTAFFAAMILLIDVVFQKIFNLILMR